MKIKYSDTSMQICAFETSEEDLGSTLVPNAEHLLSPKTVKLYCSLNHYYQQVPLINENWAKKEPA